MHNIRLVSLILFIIVIMIIYVFFEVIDKYTLNSFNSVSTGALCIDTDGVDEIKEIKESSSGLVGGLNIKVVNAENENSIYLADLEINGDKMALSSNLMLSNSYEPNYPKNKVRYLIKLIKATNNSVTLRVNNQTNYYTSGKAIGLRSSVYEPGLAKGVVYGENRNKCSYEIDESIDNSLYYDCCQDSEKSNVLNEVFCNPDSGRIEVVGRNCPGGCVDGICVNN